MVVKFQVDYGRQEKEVSSFFFRGKLTVAEVKASSPIRTSLFEREGSMWGLDEATFTKA